MSNILNKVYDQIEEDKQVAERAYQRKVVCLVGRRRDWRLLREAEVQETQAGNIVLTVGCIGPDGPTLFHDETAMQACKELHFDKIRVAREVLLVSTEIGEDTQRDLLEALAKGKVIRFYHHTLDEIWGVINILSRFGFYNVYQPDDNTFYQIGH
jgi:hypothetical protein